MLHFGNLRHTDRGLVGRYALHIQCPWRIEGGNQIVVGSSDYYSRADDNLDASWEPGTVTGHLQNQILGTLFEGIDVDGRSYINQTAHFEVTKVSSDCFGGAMVFFTGGYVLVLFPSGSRGEAWRLFEPGSESPHMVVEDGVAKSE